MLMQKLIIQGYGYIAMLVTHKLGIANNDRNEQCYILKNCFVHWITATHTVSTDST